MRRNLSAGEIVGQVLALQADRGTLPKRLNVVIMGMGEPMHNYENVMRAIRLMADKEGMSLSPRRITLSTSGVVPGLQRLAAETVIPNLAVSLNATTDEVRDILIPINRKWNIATLMQACRDFPLERRRRITFEYVLIAGMNDSDADALRLVRLLRGMKQKVNLIPLNADPWVPLKTPGEERILAFQKILLEHHITAYIRRPRGDDVSAACGMLAGREQPRGDAGAAASQISPQAGLGLPLSGDDRHEAAAVRSLAAVREELAAVALCAEARVEDVSRPDTGLGQLKPESRGQVEKRAGRVRGVRPLQRRAGVLFLEPGRDLGAHLEAAAPDARPDCRQ